MASKFDDHYKLAYATVIIQEYEKAALKSACVDMNRKAAAVPINNSFRAMEMALDSAESALKGQGYMTWLSTPSEDEEIPNESSLNTARTIEEREIEWSGNEGTFIERHVGALSADDQAHVHADAHADSAGDVNACDENPGLWESMGNPDKQWQGWEGDNTEGWDGSKAIKGALENLLPKGTADWWNGEGEGGESPKDYMENCFSCFMNFDFSWQFPPLNLMAEIEKLLKILEDLIDWIMERFKKSKEFIIDFLCNFSWVFDILCPLDWIAFMAMLSALLKKYMMDGFGLLLDWTGIVGPIIKVIVDSIAGLLEAIVALITQPIDCLIGVLRTADAVVKGAMDLVNTTSDFAQHMWGHPVAGTLLSLGMGGGGGGDFKVEHGATHGMMAPDFQKVFGNIWTDMKTLSPPQKKAEAPMAISWKGPATGYAISGNSNLSEATKKGIFKKKDFKYISTMVLALQEVKQWIHRLAHNIIMALKALTMLFSGKLKLNIMKSGLIMMVIDLIAFIMALLNTKWDTECDEREQAEQVANIINEIEGEDAFTEVSSMLTALGTVWGIQSTDLVDGQVSFTPVQTCTLDSDSEKVNNWDNHFDVIIDNNSWRHQQYGI